MLVLLTWGFREQRLGWYFPNFLNDQDHLLLSNMSSINCIESDGVLAGFVVIPAISRRSFFENGAETADV